MYVGVRVKCPVLCLTVTNLIPQAIPRGGLADYNVGFKEPTLFQNVSWRGGISHNLEGYCTVRGFATFVLFAGRHSSHNDCARSDLPFFTTVTK